MDNTEVIEKIKLFDPAKFKFPEIFSDYDGKTSGAKVISFLFGILGIIVGLACVIVMLFLTFHKSALEMDLKGNPIVDTDFLQAVLTLFCLPCEVTSLGAFVTHKIMDKDRTITTTDKPI